MPHLPDIFTAPQIKTTLIITPGSNHHYYYAHLYRQGIHLSKGCTSLLWGGETVTSLHQLPRVNSKHQGCGVSPRHTHGGAAPFSQALIRESVSEGLLCSATAPKPCDRSAQAARRAFQIPQARKPQHLQGRTCMNSAELDVLCKEVPVLLRCRSSSRSGSHGIGLETEAAERQWKQKLQSNPLPSKSYQAVHHQCTQKGQNLKGSVVD